MNMFNVQLDYSIPVLCILSFELCLKLIHLNIQIVGNNGNEHPNLNFCSLGVGGSRINCPG